MSISFFFHNQSFNIYFISKSKFDIFSSKMQYKECSFIKYSIFLFKFCASKILNIISKKKNRSEKAYLSICDYMLNKSSPNLTFFNGLSMLGFSYIPRNRQPFYYSYLFSNSFWQNLLPFCFDLHFQLRKS